MKKIRLLIGILVVGGVVVFPACKNGTDPNLSKASAKSARYHCPMHPTYTSDRPGDCPICGMRVVQIEPESEPDQAVTKTEAPEEVKPLFYRHPMNPEVTSQEPKIDEMGMDYVPVYPEDTGKEPGKPRDNPGLPDRAVVKITFEREQLIGVRTAPVRERILTNTIRASGRVAYDPDLYNAIVEYREGLSARENLKESSWPDVRERSDALVRSSVLRLRQMGLSQTQIDRLGRAADNPTNLLLSQPGESVWIYAQIFEYETGQVKPGQIMKVKTAAFPGQTFQGQVVAVDTILDPKTRTLKVRGEVPTQGGLLKPEMFVDVDIEANLGKHLSIPHEAVLDTGERKIAFVKIGPGLYDPRELKLGHESNEFFEVLSGVKKGEEVVTSANFLIDSESRLKSALSGAGGHVH